MKFLNRLVGIGLFAAAPLAGATDEMIKIKSPYLVTKAVYRLGEIVKQRGQTTFVRIDHVAGVANTGKTQRATEVLIFGTSQGGTPPMERARSTGIDLTLRVLVWEDAASQVGLGYNDPAYLARLHGIA